MATIPCSFPQTISLAGFTITFVEVDYDNVNDTSTWTYQITNENATNDLSNWVLQLCFDDGNPFVSCSLDPAQGTCGIQMNDPNICTDSDPTDPCGGEPLSGIKFDGLALENLPGQTQTYTFTLNKQYAQEMTCFGIKFGNNVVCANICGPSPECNLVPPPPGRGVIL